jgi:GT2 family glycosyltransferase
LTFRRTPELAQCGLASVVIPTFNRARAVCRAIDSVLAQTYPSIEIIVVDDGSTDATARMLAQRYGGDSRVRCVVQENAGAACARNAGFAKATGAYVALLDSDDTWRPWKLELQVKVMEAFPELGMTWTDMEAADRTGTIMHARYLRRMYAAYRHFPGHTLFRNSCELREVVPDFAARAGTARLASGSIFPAILMGNLVHTSTVVLRRERLERVSGFDERLRFCGEDYDFHLRTCREGPVGLIDVPSIRYQLGMPDRLTAQRHMIHCARNTLRTVEGAIERERGIIDLPAGALRQRLAAVHAWVGNEHRARGENEQARRHYLASLGKNPFQPRVATRWLRTLVPSLRHLRRFGAPTGEISA